MIHSSVTSFSAVIFSSAKPASGVKVEFSETGPLVLFYETDRHSQCLRTGCSQAVDPEFTQLLHSLLLSDVDPHMCPWVYV